MHGGDTLDKTFRIALIVKSLDGLLETVGGILLLAVSQSHLDQLARSLTQGELSRDPHDFIALHLLHSAHSLTTGGRIFGALYLLSHGLIKIVLVVAVLLNKLWAYPWMIAFLGVFIIYQTYRLFSNFSPGLLGLTVFDVFVLWLTYIEYNRHLHEHLTPK